MSAARRSRALLAGALLLTLSACASAPSAPSLDAARLSARDATLTVCPGAPPAAAQALQGLAFGASLMDAAWELADASHDTRAVEGLGDLFPGVKAEAKQRVLTVTPVRVKLGAPMTLLYAVTTAQDAELIPFEGVERLNTALLGCTPDGAAPGYRIVGDLGKGTDGTVQPQGSDAVVLPGGDVLTTVRLMYALPNIMEFSVFTANIGRGPDGAPAAEVGDLNTLASQFNGPSPDPERFGETARNEARAGGGWYPLDGALDRWVYLAWSAYQHPDLDLIDEAGGPDVYFAKEPRPEVPYEAYSKPTLAGTLSRAQDGALSVTKDAPYEAWVWVGDANTACPSALRCGRFDDLSDGQWKWHVALPFAWTAGVWTTSEAAVKALRAAGVDLSQGALMPTAHDPEAPPVVEGVAIETKLPY